MVFNVLLKRGSPVGDDGDYVLFDPCEYWLARGICRANALGLHKHKKNTWETLSLGENPLFPTIEERVWLLDIVTSSMGAAVISLDTLS